eukprot:247965-Pelagomonas_calceolata.AAC.5
MAMHNPGFQGECGRTGASLLLTVRLQHIQHDLCSTHRALANDHRDCAPAYPFYCISSPQSGLQGIHTANVIHTQSM